MKKIAKITLILLGLLVVAIALIPFFINVNQFKPQIIAAIEDKTGRSVKLDGEISLRIFPTIAITVKNVSISNPAWAGGGDMLVLPSVSLGAALKPLLHKKLEITSIEMDSPTILLVKKGDQANWKFDKPIEEKSSPSSKKTESAPLTVGIEHLFIGNANLTFKDLSTGTTQRFQNLNIKLAAPKPEIAAEIGINGLYNNEKLTFESGINTPLALLSGKESSLEARLSYGDINGIYKGTLRLGTVLELKGKVTSKSFIIKEKTSYSSTKKEGAQSGWDKSRIDLSALSSVNADLKVQIDNFTINNTSITPLAFDVTLKNGQLRVNAPDINVYGGNIAVNATANPAGAITASVALRNVQAEPLLKDWAGNDSIQGTLSGNTSVATKGKSQSEWISSLSGQGKLSVQNGAIKGKNFAATIRQWKSLGGASGAQTEKTDFSELSGSYTIANGVVRNSDLYMKSPLIRLRGQGEIALPPKQIRYTLKPEIVASLKGQGGRDDHAGVTVPILVSGAWENPSITLDMKSAITDNLTPDKIGKTIENVKDLKKIDKKEATETLKGLFGR